MKITVINGSPKGENSVTIQYVRYMEKKVPGFVVREHLVAKEIAGLERQPEKLAAIAESIRASDAVIWSVPAYHLTVPSQLVRFFELFDQSGHSKVLKGKPAGVVVTSIHYFDHLVVNWLRMASEDRGMRFIEAISPEMNDLLDPKMRGHIQRWGEEFIRGVSENETVLPGSVIEKRPVRDLIPANIPAVVKTGDKKIVILTDSEDPSGNLKKMIAAYTSVSENRVEVLDIRTSGLRGGCLGCIHCGYENACVYKDGFSDWYLKNVGNADAIVLAAGIQNRAWGSYWKMFHDRTFFMNHRQEYLGKQIGFIVSGPLSDNPGFREELEARAEVWGGNFNGIVNDDADSASVTSALSTLAKRVDRNAATGYRKPMTYLGTGGMKIFRDFIYRQKFLFRMDHKSYKKNGTYDFPQKNWSTRIANLLLTPLMNIPGFRKMFQTMIPKEMASPLRSVVKSS
jgi:multimeric flavodoxin WrbA